MLSTPLHSKRNDLRFAPDNFRHVLPTLQICEPEKRWPKRVSRTDPLVTFESARHTPEPEALAGPAEKSAGASGSKAHAGGLFVSAARRNAEEAGSTPAVFL